eukprot:CAMPEP_0174854476 /NCGR_PEP_ID=MMETSP1114-20130205/31271_1 /TAXON_ID=312471 /ORGANISM="Neobodo designis, Strain CCAP 1951/1" /LENGTH=36 /DNA_ID= /DNA_START= /DNA_END= /DNA_ORIENTATION=
MTATPHTPGAMTVAPHARSLTSPPSPTDAAHSISTS